MRSPSRGSSTAHRKRWTSAYENRPYHELPWFRSRPSEEVVDAVRQRFFPPRCTVLDIGCGAGSNVLYLARRGYRAYGIDISPKAIEAARDRAQKAHLRIQVRAGDALDLPYSRARFQAANDRGCFHTIPIARRTEYAAEVGRVIRPGGAFLIIWVGREETKRDGPPHRPSLEEVARAFEKWFIFEDTQFYPPERRGERAGYVAHLRRRSRPQPSPR